MPSPKGRRRNGALAELPPREALRRAAALQKEARRMEAVALRQALRATSGFERRAAELLGIGRTTLRYMLETRHQPLQRFAASLRRRAGYMGGNPQHQDL